MKLIIIKDDGAVYKDNVSFAELSLPTIPSDVHALQWKDSVGHIEFTNNVKANEAITELPSWANDALTAWQNAYDTKQAEIARLQAEAEARKLAKQTV
jgi:glycogen debranching enzyme